MSNSLLAFCVLSRVKLTTTGLWTTRSLELLLGVSIDKPRSQRWTLLTLLGELDVEDENGKKATLHQGEAFFVRRQSRIIFSTKRFALVFKCSSYAAGLGKSKELIV